MAAVQGIAVASLARWHANQQDGDSYARPKPGRPKVISASVAWKLRQRYLDSYGQWGPRVLACWADREGLGRYSPTTIAGVIADLRPEKPPKLEPWHYEVTAPGAVWSEDGASFKERGKKSEMILVQDECSRYKTGHALCSGPASGKDVRKLLEELFQTHGAPLVLKRDGGSIFDEDSVRALLDEWGVLSLVSPPGTPRYNGKMERAVRDVRSHERAQREHGAGGTLEERIDLAIEDLNEHRPRPVLGGRTATEVFEDRCDPIPNRQLFRRKVEQRTLELKEEAASRREMDAASRKAIEDVLSSYGLMKWKGNASTYYRAETVTN